MIDFSKLKTIIENNNSFILTTHVNPDADAIGSEMAFYGLLKKLNKKVEIINTSSTPYNLEFLDTQKIIQKFDKEIHKQEIENADVVVFLDLNRIERVVRIQESLKNSSNLFVCIDHHQDPGDFAKHFFIDTSYTSTGEIIYDFIQETKIVELDYEIALPIYAAIMTDTGSFRFERTTPETHRKTAKLLEAGVDPKKVYMEIYDNGEISKIKLLGEAINSMKLNKSNEICYMTLTQEIFHKTGADEADTDGFVNYCLSIKGVRIGILFYELKKGLKISFRSKDNIAVNELAAEFDGGGHYHASGARIFDVELEELKSKVIKAAEKYL